MKKPTKGKPASSAQHEKKQVIPYPGYDRNSNPLLNDVAVVVLATSITFSSKVNAIKLPSNVGSYAQTTYVGQRLTVIGYGIDVGVNLSSTNSSSPSEHPVIFFLTCSLCP